MTSACFRIIRLIVIARDDDTTFGTLSLVAQLTTCYTSAPEMVHKWGTQR